MRATAHQADRDPLSPLNRKEREAAQDAVAMSFDSKSALALLFRPTELAHGPRESGDGALRKDHRITEKRADSIADERMVFARLDVNVRRRLNERVLQERFG